MIPIATQLAAANGACTQPASRTGQLPQVPYSLFGLGTNGGAPIARGAAKEARRNGIVEYLRTHGGYKSSDIAAAFGVSAETTVKDLREMRAEGRVRRDDSRSPYLWEAAEADEESAK
ncbi:DeoR family transcriptional regulator [Aromatoleum toluolicum]|uniref:DeoR family transcriptional regulator n=1 Tax=Aromatoleum toluolicum TaxID=90060 RepID=A0ABX1NGP1_9RHOO|nr:DeoR family transcriptional regulator [Aromatoleum toluolicum]NMF98429.1 DeoR family transcriptional regulator [Aromatoleum toluolicum]